MSVVWNASAPTLPLLSFHSSQRAENLSALIPASTGQKMPLSPIWAHTGPSLGQGSSALGLISGALCRGSASA